VRKLSRGTEGAASVGPSAASFLGEEAAGRTLWLIVPRITLSAWRACLRHAGKGRGYPEG
jgi:hypothetical protein